MLKRSEEKGREDESTDSRFDSSAVSTMHPRNVPMKKCITHYGRPLAVRWPSVALIRRF